MAQRDVNGAENAAATAAAAAHIISAKPALYVKASEADDAAMFYKAAFGFVEVARSSVPKRIELNPFFLCSDELYLPVHADIINNSTDAPGIPTIVTLETKDVGAGIAKAVSFGAVQLGEVVEEGGVSFGRVKDPYGFVWEITSPGFFGRNDIVI